MRHLLRPICRLFVREGGDQCACHRAHMTSASFVLPDWKTHRRRSTSAISAGLRKDGFQGFFQIGRPWVANGQQDPYLGLFADDRAGRRRPARLTCRRFSARDPLLIIIKGQTGGRKWQRYKKLVQRIGKIAKKSKGRPAPPGSATSKTARPGKADEAPARPRSARRRHLRRYESPRPMQRYRNSN